QVLFATVTPCLEGTVDTTDEDPAEPGLQIGCTVSDVQNIGQTTQTETVIPRCPMSAPDTPTAGTPHPCWWVKANPAVCATPSTPHPHREPHPPPASGTTIQVRCASK